MFLSGHSIIYKLMEYLAVGRPWDRAQLLQRVRLYSRIVGSGAGIYRTMVGTSTQQHHHDHHVARPIRMWGGGGGIIGSWDRPL